MSQKHVKGGYDGPQKGLYVRVRQNPDGSSDVMGAMRKLTKLMQTERFVQDLKRHKHYVAPGERRREQQKEARKRHLKNLRIQRQVHGF